MLRPLFSLPFYVLQLVPCYNHRVDKPDPAMPNLLGTGKEDLSRAKLLFGVRHLAVRGITLAL
jgi:hypothetical protein